MQSKQKPVFFATTVEVAGKSYDVRGHVHPMSKFPHVGYDSPRKWDIYPASISGVLHIFDEDGNVTFLHGAQLHAAERAYLAEWVIDQTAARMIAKAVV